MLYLFLKNLLFMHLQLARQSMKVDLVKGLGKERDSISHASDFGSISGVKTSSPSANGSLVSAQGAMSSPIAVAPVSNLPTIVASESSSLSGNISSLTIGAVEMQNSLEPASPAVATSEKNGTAVTLENSVATPVYARKIHMFQIKFASGLCCYHIWTSIFAGLVLSFLQLRTQ